MSKRSCECAIPKTLDLKQVHPYGWEAAVDQTQLTKEGDPYHRFWPDHFGNNFGVGDTVLYNPRLVFSGSKKPAKEGIALEIHQYAQKPESGQVLNYPERTFGVLVDFGESEKIRFHPSAHLTAVTNDHALAPRVDKIPDLKNILIFSSEPMNSKMRDVLEDPVARAIWMGYRRAHIIDQYGLSVLEDSALNLAAELRKNPLPENRLSLWFKNKMKPKINITLATFMVPYLTGEKIATYKTESPI